MFLGGSNLWGMHFIWWFFWIFAFGSFFSLLTPVPRHRVKRLLETPADTLLRRLAAGEIDEQEYERRKAIVDRDSRNSPAKPGRAVAAPTSAPLTT